MLELFGQLKRLAIAQRDSRINQGTDVVLRSPHLRHGPLDVEQGIDGFHPCPYGVLSCVDTVPHRLSKLADEGEVDSVLRYHGRPVAGTTRQKERHAEGQRAGV